MTPTDLFFVVSGLAIMAIDFLWEYRRGVATLIALALLTGIMNNLQAIVSELHFIEEVIKERFPEPNTSESDDDF